MTRTDIHRPKTDTIRLEDCQLFTITHALRIAAERFDEHNRTCNSLNRPGLAEVFERQSHEARALAQQLDNAEFAILQMRGDA